MNKEDPIPETAIEQIEDLELEREPECIDFAVGDYVVYPHHGAGQVVKKEDKEIVKKVLAVLADDVSEMPKNWNRRFKHNRDKIKTGDIYELAEVVRNLAVREQDKGLSTGEKQMYTRAKKILPSKMMYALEMGEEQAEEHLDTLLQRSGEEKLAGV